MTNKDNKIKVLLVEDDGFLVKMYETKFALEHFDTDVTEKGKEVVRMARENQYEIILLDIILPEMDGWQILEKLKADEKTKKIPVILLTNLGQEKDMEKGLALGAADYLIKAHFTPAEVVDKVKKVLNISTSSI